MSITLLDYLLSLKNQDTKLVIKDTEQNYICTTFIDSALYLDSDLLKRTVNRWYIYGGRIIYIYLDEEHIEPVIPVTGIELNETSIAIDINDTVVLLAQVIPEDATDKSLTWLSTDEEIVTVENGLVTGIKDGTASVIVSTVDGGYTATCEIVVIDGTIIPVEDILLNDSILEMNVGSEDILLEATVLPENATNKSVFWISSNEEVVTVENGVVHAISEGEAIITVVSAENFDIYKECGVIVRENPQIVHVTGIELTPNTLELTVGVEPQTINAIISPENATNKSISWSSSNENVAYVSDEGVVIIVAEGTATITAITVDGGYTSTCEIIVNSVEPIINVTGVSLSENSLTLSTSSEPVELVANIEPSDATNKEVTWSSTDEQVATVLDGVITVVGVGEATISVTTVDGNYSDSCVVIVE